MPKNQQTDQVIDPNNSKESYQNWKDKGEKLDGVSKYNADLILEYIHDMELGMNTAVSVKKGARSKSRLNSLRSRIKMMAVHLQKYKPKLTQLTDKDIIEFFHKMGEGTIKKQDGKKYLDVGTYAKTFAAFWHWWIKVNRKKGIIIEDITVDLYKTNDRKPEWTYFTLDEMKKMADSSRWDYRVLMYFLFDSGIRAPKELMNVKVSDLMPMKNSDKFELNIRDETSKTFGRRIKLLLCSGYLKRYVEGKNLKKDDFIFQINPQIVNRYLKRISEKVLGNNKLVTMYDLRHNSCCYWLPRYKSESALKYRFGWKKSDMIIYYSEFLGMKDTIVENDLIEAEELTTLQKRLEQAEQRIALMQEKDEINARLYSVINQDSNLRKLVIDKAKSLRL